MKPLAGLAEQLLRMFHAGAHSSRFDQIARIIVETSFFSQPIQNHPNGLLDPQSQA
jgi:hypothetical protein